MNNERIKKPSLTKLTLQKKMDKKDYDKLPSYPPVECPACYTNETHPEPGCQCRLKYGFHVMEYHHDCSPLTNQTSPLEK